MYETRYVVVISYMYDLNKYQSSRWCTILTPAVCRDRTPTPTCSTESWSPRHPSSWTAWRTTRSSREENIWRYSKILSDPGRGVDHLKAAADVGVAGGGRVAAAAGEGGSEDQPGGALPDPHDAAPQHRQRHVLPQAVLRLRGRASNKP